MAGIFNWKRVSGSLVIAMLLASCAAQQHHVAGKRAMEKGDYPKAVAEFAAAAELSPLDVEYQRDWLRNRELATNRLLAKADAAYFVGNMREAEIAYQTVLKYEPNNARALAGRSAVASAIRADADADQARQLMKTGDIEGAQRFVERALDRIPSHAAARAIKQQIDEAASLTFLGEPNLGNLYRKPINLEFRDASIKSVFDALSRTTGINFIFDRDVKGDQRTTVFLKKTPFEDAVDVILSTNQLEKKVLNASSVLIYPNTPAKIKEHQDLLVKAFYLSNVDAKTAANLLKTVLRLKDIYIDEKYHMLVLRENAETIALATKLIALQDLEEPEVMLEVEVLEVNRTRLMNLGVQLTNQLTVAPLSSLSTGTAGGSGSDSSPTFKLSDLLHLNSDKLGVTLPSATLSLQKTDGDANLLANPRLRVRDREKAKILIGDKVPVVTTTTTPNGFLSENVQYLDVGLKLDVEPEIHLRDEIGLKLGLEVSSLVGSIKTATGGQAYQIGTRTIATSLRLKDGETQVLAGLISDADRTDANRVPFLGDVPLLGRLFSSQKDDRQKTEIVMAITPHLIRNIQRRSSAAETFWSGTESTLRTKAVRLGTMDSNEKVQDAGRASSPVQKILPNTTGISLGLDAPKSVRVGQPFTVQLKLDTQHALRAAPMQFAYNPAAFEAISVEPGPYFVHDGGGQFSSNVDRDGGRIAVGLSSAEGKPASGAGIALKVTLIPINVSANGNFGVIGFTPVGSTQALSGPPLPVSASVEIAP